MSTHGLLKRGAYHVLHPLLRTYREMQKPRNSARAILLCADELLLVKHIGVDHWSLPGGVMHRFETPIRCARREIREELGIPVGSAEYQYRLGTYRGERGDLVHVFVISVPSLRHKRDWELDEARWFKLADLPKALSPATARRIDEFMSGKRGVRGTW